MGLHSFFNLQRRSPSLRSESSLEHNLRITVGNDRYCIGTPERRRLPDRLGSPIDNLSDRYDPAQVGIHVGETAWERLYWMGLNISLAH